MSRQRRVLISNKETVVPSGKMKHNAESKRGTESRIDSAGADIVRLSPYVRRTAKQGSNCIEGAIASPSSITQTVTSSATLTKPQTEAPLLNCPLKSATTFVFSVLSLCSKLIASSSDISEPLPREDTFLHLVSLCGIAESKYWAEMMGFEHRRSYALLSKLL
jgi:hypothetical protein